MPSFSDVYFQKLLGVTSELFNKTKSEMWKTICGHEQALKNAPMYRQNRVYSDNSINRARMNEMSLNFYEFFRNQGLQYEKIVQRINRALTDMTLEIKNNYCNAFMVERLNALNQNVLPVLNDWLCNLNNQSAERRKVILSTYFATVYWFFYTGPCEKELSFQIKYKEILQYLCTHTNIHIDVFSYEGNVIEIGKGSPFFKEVDVQLSDDIFTFPIIGDGVAEFPKKNDIWRECEELIQKQHREIHDARRQVAQNLRRQEDGTL